MHQSADSTIPAIGEQCFRQNSHYTCLETANSELPVEILIPPLNSATSISYATDILAISAHLPFTLTFDSLTLNM